MHLQQTSEVIPVNQTIYSSVFLSPLTESGEISNMKTKNSREQNA